MVLAELGLPFNFRGRDWRSNGLQYIVPSTMNKKTIEKITSQPNYNQVLFTHAVGTTQALQQLRSSTESLPSDHQKQLHHKQKQLEQALKNAINALGKFSGVQKTPLASPLDYTLQIFEALSDNIQTAVQRYREHAKNGTLEKPKPEKDEQTRPQDKYTFIKPARFQFHSHEKDLSHLRSDLSFTPSHPITEQFRYVNTEESLREMIIQLSQQSQIAVDVEHSNRSYEGFTCLLQFSSRSRDYIVDVFPIWPAVPALKQIMENSAIVKVMHGAEMDTKWLQRDFNIHIHNLFDTYRAARTLGMPKLSYAYLLTHYCNVSTDKSFQTADWRQRPLSTEMLHYARLDTHYLLQIFDRLRADIHQKALSMRVDPQQVFIDIYSASHEVTKAEVELFDFTKKQCLLQLRKQFKDGDYEVFCQTFRIIDQIAQENDLPFDEIVNHRIERQIISKIKELFLVKAQNINIKIDRIIADLRSGEHQFYLKAHLTKIKDYLTSFFDKRQSSLKKDKKGSKANVKHIEEHLMDGESIKSKPIGWKVAFREYTTKTYQNLDINPFSMLRFQPIAVFLANRLGVSSKDQEQSKVDEQMEEEESAVEGESAELEKEESNPEGVIQFKRMNPNVIYTVQENEVVHQKSKPRKKRKQEEYQHKIQQKQKNIFQLLED